VVRHRQIEPFADVTNLEVRSLDERPLPLQVDGDYIGEVHEAFFGVTPRGIAVVA
jgi:diacylglycerol kinase family enzyme